MQVSPMQFDRISLYLENKVYEGAGVAVVGLFRTQYLCLL